MTLQMIDQCGQVSFQRGLVRAGHLLGSGDEGGASPGVVKVESVEVEALPMLHAHVDFELIKTGVVVEATHAPCALAVVELSLLAVVNDSESRLGLRWRFHRRSNGRNGFRLRLLFLFS